MLLYRFCAQFLLIMLLFTQSAYAQTIPVQTTSGVRLIAFPAIATLGERDGRSPYKAITVDDSNADGIDEFIRTHLEVGIPSKLVISMHDGLSGERAWERIITTPADTLLLHSDLLLVGDIDGNGASDLVVGIPELNSLYFVNIRNGQIVRHLSGARHDIGEPEGFGSQVWSLGDIDGDRISELGIIVHGGGGHNVRVYSPGVDQVIQSIFWDYYSPFDWIVFYDAADINNDGIKELVCNRGVSFGPTEYFDARTATVIHRVNYPAPGYTYGVTVDADRDGMPDHLILQPDLWQVYSSATGQKIYEFPLPDFWSIYATTVNRIADINGDSVEEILVTQEQWPDPTKIYVISGATGERIYERAHAVGENVCYVHAHNVGFLDQPGFTIWTESGSANKRYRRTFRFARPGEVEIFGKQCSDSAPRISILSVSTPTFEVGNTTEIMLLGEPGREYVPILSVGEPMVTPAAAQSSCDYYVDPDHFASLNTVRADSSGIIRVPVQLPFDAALIGMQLNIQVASDGALSRGILGLIQ